MFKVVNTSGVLVNSATVAQTFLGLTFCFKFLRKQLVGDIFTFLGYVSPLLVHAVIIMSNSAVGVVSCCWCVVGAYLG